MAAAAGDTTCLMNLKKVEPGLSTAVKSAYWVGRMKCRFTNFIMAKTFSTLMHKRLRCAEFAEPLPRAVQNDVKTSVVS